MRGLVLTRCRTCRILRWQPRFFLYYILLNLLSTAARVWQSDLLYAACSAARGNPDYGESLTVMTRRVRSRRPVSQSGRRYMALDHGNADGVPVGNGRHISPAEFLLMAGYLTYRASLAPIDARVAARRVLDAVLGAAAAHGFAHADALESMM